MQGIYSDILYTNLLSFGAYCCNATVIYIASILFFFNYILATDEYKVHKGYL